MNKLARIWASLGVAYYADPTEIPSTPEDGIIEFLKSGEFPEDKKMMEIILGWLEENSKLVHVERLKNLSKALSEFEMAVLGAIAKKCAANGDHRWNVIVKTAREKVGEKRFSQGDTENFIGVKGLDCDFSEFGIRIGTMRIESVEKKLIPRKFLIKKNTWLKNRILFGTNVRADIATIRELGLAQTAYRASKIASCSMQAAYNNWSDLEEANWFVDEKNPA